MKIMVLVGKRHFKISTQHDISPSNHLHKYTYMYMYAHIIQNMKTQKTSILTVHNEQQWGSNEGIEEHLRMCVVLETWDLQAMAIYPE